jgi:hypothetical protein
VAIASGKCLLLPGDYIIPNNLTMPIISPKLQLLSGHTAEQNLAVYRALALSDVTAEYEAAMRVFPVR